MVKKVLIVEDMEEFHVLWKGYLNDFSSEIVLLSAFSIEEAEELFSANSDIDAIVMDACVPGDEPNTQPLVRKFRKTFAGPIIASSSVEEYRKELIKAGCDYESESKATLPEKLLEILQ